MDNLTSAMLYLEILPGWLAMRCVLEKLGTRHTRRVAFISKQRPLSLALMVLLLSMTAVSVHGQDNLAAQASALMQAGKFHDAELLWRQLEAQEPKNSSVHNSLGFALAQQGELDLAAVEYQSSLTLDPHQPDVAFALGVTEFKRGHFSAAIPEFESFARAKPEDPRGALLLGMSHYGLHEYTKATPYLQKAIQNDPSNLELRNVLAQNCLWDQQYDCAMDQFKSIVSLNPEAVQAHMLLAEALDGMDKTPDAIKELEEAERLSPNEPVLHFEL